MELEHWQLVQNFIPRSDILRIVLIGETGAGKSSSGNTIFGRRVFTTKSSDRDISVGCVQDITCHNGQWLSIVDTPGFFDPNKSNVEVEREIANGVALAAPGPHVLLLVLRPDGIKYKEQTERETVKMIEKIFGKGALCYTMVLFTHGDDLGHGRTIKELIDLEHGKTIEDFIDQSPDLGALISQCGGGYHVFNNRDEDPSQVRELLKKINTMVQSNGGMLSTGI
ncbi:GTPase IMAP family member 9-like [Engraulis encrasicolus]|uniref:GTPase IMAP family member 9-like n=1 Tax=Engraulis encrasicolus TaxID=184585 RepID=UPI002FD249B5